MHLDQKRLESLTLELHKYVQDNCIFVADPNVEYIDGGVGVIPSKGYGLNRHQYFLRRLTHHPVALTMVAEIFLHHMLAKQKGGEEDGDIQLAGLESGSLPIIAAMQALSCKYGHPINAFTIRKKRKSYGIFNYVEGKPTDSRVVLIDDLVNTGSSMAFAYDLCYAELGLEPARNAYCIVDTYKGGRTHIEWRGRTVQLNSILSGDSFDKSFSSERYWLPKDCRRELIDD